MLGIVGGSGRLPRMLEEAVPEARRYVPEGVDGVAGPAATFRPERLGELIGRLHADGVGEIVFAGAMPRPELHAAALDAFTRAEMERLGPALLAGDDALLRTVLAIFERSGFKVLAAHEIRPDLLPAAGVPTVREPGERDRADAERGFAVLSALAPLDVGQACAVAGGQVLAIEALGGTDWMLDSLGSAVIAGRRGSAAGVLCKAPKLGQDRRVDLPTIGPATLRRARAAGLGGVAVEAGGVLVLDLAATVAAADAAGLFLWVREP